MRTPRFSAGFVPYLPLKDEQHRLVTHHGQPAPDVYRCFCLRELVILWRGEVAPEHGKFHKFERLGRNEPLPPDMIQLSVRSSAKSHVYLAVSNSLSHRAAADDCRICLSAAQTETEFRLRQSLRLQNFAVLRTYTKPCSDFRHSPIPVSSCV